MNNAEKRLNEILKNISGIQYTPIVSDCMRKIIPEIDRLLEMYPDRPDNEQKVKILSAEKDVIDNLKLRAEDSERETAFNYSKNEIVKLLNSEIKSFYAG